MGIPIGGPHFKQAVTNIQDGHVKGAAPQVKDQDGLIFLFVQAIGQGCRRWLVDDAQDVQASNLAGILGGLTLGVVKVSGHGDDGVRHLLAQVLGRVFYHPAEDGGRDFLGGI